jgi:hypothetical protein
MTTNEQLVERIIETGPQFCAALTYEEVQTFIKYSKLVEAELTR